MALGAYLKTCARHTPGNLKLILVPADKADTITIASGEVTILTLEGSGDKAYEVEFDLDGLKRTEEGVTTKGGLFNVTQKLEMHLSKSSKTLKDFITGLADQSVCGLVAIVEDANGVRWVMGVKEGATSGVAKGMYMESGNFDSGMAPDEEEGDKFVVTLTGLMPNYSIPVKSTSTIGTATAGVITQNIIIAGS